MEGCTVVAKGTGAGGISGYITSNDTSISQGSLVGNSPNAKYVAGIVVDTKVYGSTRVGGAIGDTVKHVSRYIVKNCEIRGYQYVGGIAGIVRYSRDITQGYCANSLITKMTEEVRRSHGITKPEPNARKLNLNCLAEL